MGTGVTPAQVALALSRFSDAIFPGDDLFPAGSTTGAHGLLAARLRERLGEGAPERLAEALIARGVLDDATAAAATLQSEEPAVFDTARTYLTFAYYEAPAVIAAIRALGHTYNDAPQPHGYSVRPFEPARDAPAQPRGSYIKTADVRRVDLSGLTFLTENERGG